MPNPLSHRRAAVWFGAAVLFSPVLTARSADAEITEERTLVIYNSLDPVKENPNNQNSKSESEAIALYYKQLHPDVLMFNLATTYSWVTPPENEVFLPECGLTRTLITPCKFEELFLDEESAFQEFLAAHPEICCIVTTRGVPTLITDDAYPNPIKDQVPGQGTQPWWNLSQGTRCWASVEAVLTRIRIGPLGGPDLGTASDCILNPYYAEESSLWSAAPLDEWLVDHPESPLIAVSRLDSAALYNDVGVPVNQGALIKTNVRCVKDMILHSVAMRANKYATTVLTDTSSGGGTGGEGTRVSAWLDNWCVMDEHTHEFIIGPRAETLAEEYWSEQDEAYNQYQMIAVDTSGRNGYPFPGDPNYPDPLQPPYYYVSMYSPHHAGVFCAGESFGGWMLHTYYPNNSDPYVSYPNFGQGQALEWIASGGGFAICSLHEPSGPGVADFRTLIKSWLVTRRQWGEASLASLNKVGNFHVALGDPLASVMAFDPDITGDRIVDSADEAIILANFGQPGDYEDGDINGDGIVNSGDRTYVLQAFGRDNQNPPADAAPNWGCGDLTNDFQINADDLALFDLEFPTVDPVTMIPCPLTELYWTQPCFGDLNGNSMIGWDDRERIVDRMNTCSLMDYVAPFGEITSEDVDAFYDLFFANACVDELDCVECVNCSDPDPSADLNCDLCVNCLDGQLIEDLQGTTFPPCTE